MKGRLTEQYDLTLSKREMDELVLAMRLRVQDFECSEHAAALLEELEEIYKGSIYEARKAGATGEPPSSPEAPDDGDDEGGALVEA